MSSLRQKDLQSGDRSQVPAGISPLICFFIEKTAVLVAEKGLEYEKSIMAKGNTKSNFSFLWSSDPYHGYYQQKLSEAQNQDGIQPDDASATATATTDDDDIKAPLRDSPVEEPPKRPGLPLESMWKLPIPESDKKDPRYLEWTTYGEPQEPYILTLSQGITRKELYTIKLTAQFVARYGTSFQSSLINKKNMDMSRFEFMNQTDCRFGYFNRLAAAYSSEKDGNDHAECTDADLEGFFRLLERDSREIVEEMESQKKGVMEFQEALEKEGSVEVALIDKHEHDSIIEFGYPKKMMDRSPPQTQPENVCA